jgi:DNA-binding MarR family transcriptional regulator
MSLESDLAGQPEAHGQRESRGKPEARGQRESRAEPEARGQRFRLLDDPVAIRALAHPLRLDLLSITGHAGQITTADAARELGISHGLASHHLRQLAKYGFVRQSPGKDNRERPWRLTATSMSWRDSVGTAEGAAAAAVFEEVLAERAVAGLRSWLGRRADWPTAWREHTGVGQSTVYLTLPELADLDAAIEALIKRYVDERPLDDVASRPEGSVPVDIYQIVTVPMDQPPEGA